MQKLFKKGSLLPSGEPDTIIGASTEITGSLRAQGLVRIDGRLLGDIKVQGSLITGSESYINGDLEADDIIIAGKIDGNISSCGTLKLEATARLVGNICVANLIIEDGAIFQGNCTMQPSAPSPESGLSQPAQNQPTVEKNKQIAPDKTHADRSQPAPRLSDKSDNNKIKAENSMGNTGYKKSSLIDLEENTEDNTEASK